MSQATFVNYIMDYPLFSGDYTKATDDELFNSHAKMVYAMAKRKYWNFLNFDDIVQVGLMALHTAVKKYDRNSGVKFASYAMHRVRFDMQQFVLDDRMIKKITTKNMRKIYHNYLNYSEDNSWNLPEEKAKKFAEDHNVSVELIRKFEDSMKETYFSLDQQDDDSQEIDIEFEGNTPDQEYEINEEFFVNSEAIAKSISILSEREKKIITARFFGDKSVSLTSLSKQFGVSVERIRQIEKASLLKIKNKLFDVGYNKEDFF